MRTRSRGLKELANKTVISDVAAPNGRRHDLALTTRRRNDDTFTLNSERRALICSRISGGGAFCVAGSFTGSPDVNRPMVSTP